MKKMMLLVAALMINGAASAADVAKGEKIFTKCKPCHDVGENAKNKVGPVLNGLEGRKSGSVPGYRYSDANKNSGIVWSEAEFVDYIKDPRAKVPGTKMVFVGIKKEDEAKNLWKYISQFDDNGKTK
jgi:cytochrome c